MINPVKLFSNNLLAARFWFAVAFVLMVISIVQPIVLFNIARTHEKVIVMDESGVFHVVPVKGLEESEKLHGYISTLAADAFLNRSPAGSDNNVLLKQLYIEPACSHALKIIEGESAEFSKKNIHQKAEISEINTIQTNSNKIISQVKGQIVRTGVFSGQTFSESYLFEIVLTLVRNPNLSTNGRLPLAVWNLKYKAVKNGN